MTAEQDHPQVICGARETRPTGTWECVMPPLHPAHGHYYVRLTTKPPETP